MSNYRNPKLLKAVASLPCATCGIEGASQAAHANSPVFGKGMGIKAHDWATFPLCHAGTNGCHEKHDQRMVHLTKIERIEYERELILKTHAQMFELGMIEVKKC